MNFTQNLIQELSAKHLLKHPFYQSWSDGTLTKETLQTYAAQYFHHVSAFPRYLSATHSGCGDIKIRQMLLDNLIDEEKGDENHPELWLRFAEAMGISRDAVNSVEVLPEIKNLVETFLTRARSSYEEGLGVLFAYEHQIPEIARFKKDALIQHYGVKDSRGLSFFDVHMTADVYHTQAISEALEALQPEARVRAEAAAREGSERLWAFLDAMQCTRALAA